MMITRIAKMIANDVSSTGLSWGGDTNLFSLSKLPLSHSILRFSHLGRPSILTRSTELIREMQITNRETEPFPVSSIVSERACEEISSC